MKRLAVFFLMALSVGSALPQKRPSRGPLLDSNKPTVYLAFVRKERIKDAAINRPDRLFFRFTNNTVWPLTLEMSDYGDKRLGDAMLYYSIDESESGKNLSGSLDCHVCSFNPLGSGKSILFSIPLEDADRGATMRLKYDFSWEGLGGDFSGSSSKHIVSFYFNSLPKGVLPD